MRDLVRYIARDSPHNARLVRERLRDAASRLSLHPESGRPGRADGTRELVVPHTSYILVYRVNAGVLEIIAFIHESRQWPTDL
jgi:toxin ParE1/3/4